MLPCQVDRSVPVGSMEKSPLVLVKAGNGRPPPGVQDSPGIHENIAIVLHMGLGGQIEDGHMVTPPGTVPNRLDDLMASSAILSQTVLSRKVVEVVENLTAAGIDG